MADAQPPFDVIILAGGRGARLDGADKPGLIVGASTMAATAAWAAATAGAGQIILVGPHRPDVTAATAAWAGRLVVTREEPPGAGPVPALRAGLALVSAPWAAVLAADLPFLGGDQVLSLLAAACAGASAGAVIADESGAAQWLAGCWRTDRLTAALAAYRGSSLRALLGPLRPALIRDTGPGDGPPPWLDCDTPDELAAARDWLTPRPASPRAPGPAAAQPGSERPD